LLTRSTVPRIHSAILGNDDIDWDLVEWDLWRVRYLKQRWAGLKKRINNHEIMSPQGQWLLWYVH
jgi:hypothetical protein